MFFEYIHCIHLRIVPLTRRLYQYSTTLSQFKVLIRVISPKYPCAYCIPDARDFQIWFFDDSIRKSYDIPFKTKKLPELISESLSFSILFSHPSLMLLHCIVSKFNLHDTNRIYPLFFKIPVSFSCLVLHHKPKCMCLFLELIYELHSSISD